MSYQMLFAVVSFVVLFILISTEKFNKTILALFGAFLFISIGIIPQEKAFLAEDWNVIFLLIGMMIIVGITKHTGLFQFVAVKMVKWAKGRPFVVMIYLCLVTALFSALLDNVTTVLILTPITILVTVELGLKPIPFIIAEAISSNVGGTATLIGDPPNIMIGSAVGLSFMDFVVNLTPVVLICLALFIGMAWFFWGRTMYVSNERRARVMEFDEYKFLQDRRLLIVSLTVLGLVIVGFLVHSLIHLEAATIAMAGASLLMLLSGKHEVDKFFEEVEWGTIFFFLGLFILVGGLVEVGAIKKLAEFFLSLTGGDIKNTTLLILWVSGLFSGVVDNIPYVATMIPLIKEMGTADPALAGNAALLLPVWWALSLGACLGGNATLIGASANVVSAGLSAKSGYPISFLEFTKYGVVITLAHLAVCTVYLLIVYF
ncbi:MAG TPA: ArsB/NhaD family transporter [bacterium]|nr:ArsB/NhaD family transporter [bacterium]